MSDDAPRPHPCFKWQVIELPGGVRHLVYGFEVSKEIVKWNYAEAACLTADGKVFLLEGPPGSGGEDAFVLPNWLKWRSITKWKEVSSEVLAAIDAVRRPRPYSHPEYGRNPDYPRF